MIGKFYRISVHAYLQLNIYSCKDKMLLIVSSKVLSLTSSSSSPAKILKSICSNSKLFSNTTSILLNFFLCVLFLPTIVSSACRFDLPLLSVHSWFLKEVISLSYSFKHTFLQVDAIQSLNQKPLLSLILKKPPLSFIDNLRIFASSFKTSSYS